MAEQFIQTEWHDQSLKSAEQMDAQDMEDAVTLAKHATKVWWRRRQSERLADLWRERVTDAQRSPRARHSRASK
jgi:hypothetical protein